MHPGGDNIVPGGFEIADAFEFVPELGANNAGEDDHGDDVECVSVGSVADEISVQNDGAADSGQPKHQAKGSNMSKTEIQIGIHSGLSIAVRDEQDENGDCVQVFLNWWHGRFSGDRFRVVLRA